MLPNHSKDKDNSSWKLKTCNGRVKGKKSETKAEHEEMHETLLGHLLNRGDMEAAGKRLKKFPYPT